MKRIVATGVVGMMSCVGGVAMGGGIDAAWVEADAGWVAHIDVEGLMRSEIGSAVLEIVGMNDEGVTFEEMMAMLKDGVEDEELGLAVMREIRDVTVIGKDDDEPDLVVARTSGVVHALLEVMKEEDKFQMIEKDGHSIVSWTEDNGNDRDGFVVVLPTADKETFRVVVSDSIDKLVGAITASHVRRDGPDWIDGADGKLVFLHIEKPAEMSGHDLPAFLQDAGEIEFSLSERDGDLDASVIIETGNEDAAINLVAFANGMMALGRMAASDEPELAELLTLTKGLRLRADGTAVLVNLTVDVHTLLETVGPLLEITDDEVKVKIDIDTDKYE